MIFKNFNLFKRTVFAHSVVFLFFSTSVSSLFAKNRTQIFDDYMIKKWGVEDGLPANSLNTVIITKAGYMWIGTPSGLVRFDGVEFKTFNRLNTPILESEEIQALYEDYRGVLWIGTRDGGLYSYANKKWERYTTENGLTNNNIRAISGDWWGNLWVGTDYGLNCLTDEGFKHYTTDDGLYDNIITSLSTDNWGDLWIGTLRGGIAKLDDGTIRAYGYEDGLTNMSVVSICCDNVGNVWIGTLGGLYVLRRGEEFVEPHYIEKWLQISSIMEFKPGVILIGTISSGIKVIDHGEFVDLLSDTTLMRSHINSMAIDRSHNIWAATVREGLVRIEKAAVENITMSEEFSNTIVNSILEDSRGSLWIGTKDRGLLRTINREVVDIFDKENSLPSNKIGVIYEDDGRVLWIGTECGLVRMENGVISVISKRDGLKSDNVSAVIKDRRGTYWIGTDKGLNILKGQEIHSIELEPDLDSQEINVLLEDRIGRIFIGTADGLYMHKGNRFEKICKGVDVISLYEDSDGVVWIGTNGNGLFRFFNGNLVLYTEMEGLFSNYILSIVEDRIGNLWMSCNRGVFWINMKNVDDYSRGLVPLITSVYYNESDGMISSQCVGDSKPSCWASFSGKIYYPTIKGISIFDPLLLTRKMLPPDVVIDEVLVDGKPQVLNGSDHNLGGLKMIEFRFTAFDFSAPDKIKFLYKLEGYDSDFTYLPSGSSRIARYAGLKPGEYRFVVMAANSSGVWSDNQVIYKFKITSLQNKKIIIYVFVSVMILFAVFFFVFIYNKEKTRRIRDRKKSSVLGQERIDEAVAELKRVMEDEKLFLNPDLTLKMLSKRIRIHYNYLSYIINDRFGLNFNDFINRYRIEEAMKLLSDPGCRGKSILEIMFDAGFYSKSVFNKAFKKFAGMRPSEYRKKHLR